jgi:predicted alpha-1,2-mannosidase
MLCWGKSYIYMCRPQPSNKNNLLLSIAIFFSFLASCLPLKAYSLQNLTTNVNMFCGTGGGGNTADLFPGSVAPFGMVQWSPDTTSQWPGGYLYSDTQICGFGLTHASGAGCNYGGDCGFTPFLGNVTSSPYSSTHYSHLNAGYFSTFNHANELVSPGYYSVLFTNGIRTELTTTTRTGFGRFTYPSGNVASMLINAGGDANGTINALIQINPSGNEVSGWTQMPGMCGGANAIMYFDIVFDHPFTAYGVWNGASLTANGTNANGSNTGIYLSFNLPGGGVVLARTGISYVSVANAQANLQAESPSANFTSAGFNAMTNAASTNWNGYLNKIQVSGGTAADIATFYTMLYHCVMAPEVVSDVNGQFTGLDNNVHTVPSGHAKYGWFSGWDIYRSECQLIAILDPARAGDIAQSLVLDSQFGGGMPRWSVATADSGIMLGDPATPIIAGLYAFGGTNFDTAAALSAMVAAATNPVTKIINGGTLERDANRDYLNLGFVPEYQIGGYAPVSMTLEYCSADFALARFAQAIGDTTNYSLAMNRAQNWRNHFNPNSTYFQMRRSDSFWSPGFNSNLSTYDNYNLFAEGTGAQYIWLVPFNLGSLINWMGGPQAAAARLDNFFTQINDNNTGNTQYAYLGNEPCAATPWAYHFVGQPYKTSSVVRRAVTQLFSTSPDGFPGNDDLGQMSSWYVWAALGMYPAIPGDDVLALHGPLFPQAIVHLTNGDLTITGTGAADNAPYIQSLTINGQPSNISWLRFANVANGGTLAFTMDTTANTSWGTNLLQTPPSYTDGMTTPLAQNYLWGTGLESGETQISWTNIIDMVSPGGGSNNIGGILGGSSVPELGIRNENSQSGSAEILYSGFAQGAASNYAYLKAFDLSGQNIMVSTGMHLAYWVFPQSPNNDSLTSGNNSAYVAMDIIFTDGTSMRNSSATDQHGVSVYPTAQGNQLVLDTWNYVSVDLTPLAGKTINRIDFGYDHPNSSGGYRGYLDDVALTTPANVLGTNLALNQPASTDSQQAGNPASNGNDGNTATAWIANDDNANHWWQVDLGGLCNLTADEVIWPLNGSVYDYTVAVSADNINWSTVVNKTANTSAAQDQSDVFTATARYVRITVTGLPINASAGIGEFRVFGTLITLPSAPTNLKATAGYQVVSLSWSAVAGASGYAITRSTSSGAEVLIATTTSTNYTDNGLPHGAKYYYEVSATNILGQGGNSSEVSATTLTPPIGSYESMVVSNNPLAYWPLNETTGSVAWDVVGGHNGTYVGGVTLGQSGLSMPGISSGNSTALFDGTSGYVDIFGNPFNLTNAITTIAWVKVPATPHFSGVVGKGDTAWRMSVNGSGQPGGSDGGTDTTGPASIVGSSWHMMAYSYSGVPNVANNAALYVDGALVANNNVSTAPTGSGWDVYIGGSPDYGSGRLLPGSIAQVAVFTNLLSTFQIQSLYSAAANGAATNIADLIFVAYNNAFLINGAYPGWWTGAEEIEMAEDAYEHTPTPARQTIVSNACNGFISNNGSNWTYDKYNDDMSWAVIAFARSYLITGNTSFRNIAKSNYDAMYNRAWDTNFTGGGLWWTTDDAYKNSAVNGPATIAACLLYSIYGDSSYLSKAQSIYSWERRVLFNTNTGAIYDGITTNGGSGVLSTFSLTYNQGTFIGAGNYLYRDTGLPYYYQDAILTGKYTQNSMTTSNILPEYGSGSDLSGFNGIFARWMARFAKDQNLWSAFGPWLTTNANAAWSVRNANDLAWQKWLTPLGTNVPDNWGCSASVVIMQVADPTPADALQITPAAGFTSATQSALVPAPSSLNLTLTNIGTASVNWSLLNTSAWLNVSSSNGVLPMVGATNVTVNLIPSAVTNVPAGRYCANIVFSNQISGALSSRIFTLVIGAGDSPIAMTGQNADVLAPNAATAATPNATAFDIPNDYCFYQAGLNGSTRGLPPDGVFTSQADGATVFQFKPYGSANALLLGYTYPSSATLTLAKPQAYNSISILSCSAQGSGGTGTFVLHFANGTQSQVFNFNTPDWFATTANVAIQGIGRLKLGASLNVEDDGPVNPNMFQTTINLAALGLNQAIASITFTKPSNAGSSQVCGIFAVSGTVSVSPPAITQQPLSVTNNLPAQGVNFNVAVTGTPPLSYQWFYSTNGSQGTYTPLSVQTNSSLALSPVLQLTNAGNYFVVVTNSFGSVTSSVATLTIYRAPVITQQPTSGNISLFSGSTNTWSVSVNAALPFNYYWLLNGMAITSATNSTLQFTNLQITDSGNYSVVISNVFGSATSSVVTLNILSLPTYPYGQAVLQDKALGYWQLDETAGTIAHDYLAAKNGIYTSNVLLGQPGDNLVDTHTAAGFGFLADSNSCVTNIAVDFSGFKSAAFSVEAWVNGGGQTTDAGLITKGYGGGGEQFNLDCGGINHAFRFYVRSASGNIYLASGSIIPDSQWHHVVGVCDETNGYVNLYVDGTNVAQTTIPANAGVLVSALPVSFGSRQSGAGAAYDDQFVGYMEEVAIYGYALNSSQVRAHFLAATNRPPAFFNNPFTVSSIAAGQSYMATLATNASDPNGDAITFGKVSGPAWLTVAADGGLTGVPISSNVGVNSFVVNATDPNGLFGTATMNLTVLPAPPIVMSAVLQSNSLVLNWTGGIAPYQMQMTPNLINPIWNNVGSPVSGNSLIVTPTNLATFYRIFGQ